MDTIRKKYDAIKRHADAITRKRAPKLTEGMVADQLASIEQFWRDADGTVTDKEITYWCGWTLVPPEMMGDRLEKNFPPGSTIDAAAFRSRGRGVLLVRAVLDGNKNIHQVSVSHMIASESNQSCGAHTQAESQLIKDPRTGKCPLNSKKRVTCMDGGKQLRTAEKEAFPDTNILRCFRHLTEDVQRGNKKSKNETQEIFNKLSALPCGQKRAAEQLYGLIPRSSFLRKIRRTELCQAFLPDGVCSHGLKVSMVHDYTLLLVPRSRMLERTQTIGQRNTQSIWPIAQPMHHQVPSVFNLQTNNPSEISHTMRDSMRREYGLLRTMKHEVALQIQRKQTLMKQMLETKGGPLRANEGRLGDAWSDNSAIPEVQVEHAKLAQSANAVGCPRDLGAGRYCVEGEAGGATYTVDFGAFDRGDYHLACTCGMVASSLSTCKHFQR